MVLTIPDTLDGALVFGISAFILALASGFLIGLILAAFPLLNRSGSAPAKIAHSQSPLPVFEQEIAEGHHIAAISAAIATMMGPHRIVHIEPLHHHGLGWQAEGRAAHHGSHAFSHPGAFQRQPDNNTGNSHGTEIQNHSRRPAI